ncbi:TIGR00730 family Rossman fold protein [Candidatus Dependentiae bacterium HGW-Dependentiae-1]|nr:MAG: TIGR00730 family Rossman fold protein [Candidatus Dependentiae bacterium HGW-Dependentiae-1]
MRWFFEAMRLFFRSVWAGIWFISALFYLGRLRRPVVTIFGGKRASGESVYAQQAYEFARQLVEHKFSVLTGGGPGIMEAANCGAYNAALRQGDLHKHTLGIGVCGVNGDFVSRCAHVVVMPYFYMRKWLLMAYSTAVVVFPGGFGTADELFQLLNLMKLQKLPVRPVILIGTAYWKPLLAWIYESGVAQGFIPAESAELLVVTDDLEKALAIVRACASPVGKNNW